MSQVASLASFCSSSQHSASFFLVSEVKSSNETDSLCFRLKTHLSAGLGELYPREGVGLAELAR